MSTFPSLKVTDKVLVVDDRNDSQLKSILSDEITKNVHLAFINATAAINCITEKYDFIIATVFDPETISRQSLFTTYFSALRPGGFVFLYVSEISFGVTKQLEENLLISGFINCTSSEIKHFECTVSDSAVRRNFKDLKHDLIFMKCEKPNYEVGSTKKVSIAASSNKSDNDAALVWRLDDDDDNYINADDLLNEDDVKKPDPSSLKVCGTTGKRRACKDCSCGLAEELDAENKRDVIPAKSSCGSCYLGDAFRCASCPYLGMPAFKPGEKIQLSDQFLAADI